MKKIFFILLVSFYSCTVSVTDPPPVKETLEGELVYDRYGNKYFVNHPHYYMNEISYTLTEIKNSISIIDTTFNTINNE